MYSKGPADVFGVRGTFFICQLSSLGDDASRQGLIQTIDSAGVLCE